MTPSLSMNSVPSKLETMFLCSSICYFKASGSIPFWLKIPPSYSKTPINLAPFSVKNLEVQYPTTPKD